MTSTGRWSGLVFAIDTMELRRGDERSHRRVAMKTPKTVLLAFVALLAAAFFIGAKDATSDRPSQINAERWIKLSHTAGLVLTDELAKTGRLAAHLYVRTDKDWRGISLLNPATGQLLDEPSSPRR
jgi:hypothetical protein